MTEPLEATSLREAIAETLSWSSGEFTRYAHDASPDHNRWSWRGDGHGPALREQFLKEADAVIAGPLARRDHWVRATFARAMALNLMWVKPQKTGITWRMAVKAWLIDAAEVEEAKL